MSVVKESAEMDRRTEQRRVPRGSATARVRKHGAVRTVWVPIGAVDVGVVIPHENRRSFAIARACFRRFELRGRLLLRNAVVGRAVMTAAVHGARRIETFEHRVRYIPRLFVRLLLLIYCGSCQILHFPLIMCDPRFAHAACAAPQPANVTLPHHSRALSRLRVSWCGDRRQMMGLGDAHTRLRALGATRSDVARLPPRLLVDPHGPSQSTGVFLDLINVFSTPQLPPHVIDMVPRAVMWESVLGSTRSSP